MATAAANPKQRAHELIDRISTAQASAVVTLITSMLDPVDRAIANAPFEDEPIRFAICATGLEQMAFRR